jgi:hypothetical protein
MRKMQIMALLMLPVFSGCAYIAMSSEDKDYFSNHEYAGKSMPLLRDTLICKHRYEVDRYLHNELEDATKYEPSIRAQRTMCAQITPLPTGTMVYIRSVTPYWKMFVGNTWYAYGEVTIAGKKQRFEYRFRDAPWVYPPPWASAKAIIR